MPAYHEKEIILQLQDERKRREAFGSIVSQYSESLYWHIRRMVISHDDADDVLQNTFMKAWINIENFRGESKISTWLYRIAVNECITFLNRQKARHQVSLSDDEMPLLNILESEEYFEGDEAQLKLQKAILTLPEKQRLVFNMHYFEDMKYEEMSRILGTSVGALKASYHHAVKKIEEYFSNTL
ncbi:MAG: RNA polymerase sigma factor [Candidatus Azobacteroides sp.]|nr:RNA polymerase sigma factor [Candidatus Azobacteroides sp.]